MRGAVGIDRDVDLKRLGVVDRGLHAEAERIGGFQRIHDVQVVRPGLGEILPRMAGGVGADGALLPVRRGAVLVVPFQRLRIVGALVAEQGTERIQPALVADHPVPDPVPDLVTAMAEQGAIGLVHPVTHLLAMRVVRLVEIDGDHPVAVPGQHLGLAGDRIEHVERQPRGRIVDPVRQRDAETDQRVEQPVLRHLEPAPQRERAVVAQFRNDVVVAAGGAEGLVAIGIDQPVAGIPCGVDAQPPAPGRIGGAERGDGVVLHRQRRQRLLERQVAECGAAPLAGAVLEIEQAAALLAVEEFHDVSGSRAPVRSETS